MKQETRDRIGHEGGLCGCFEEKPTRRSFLAGVSCALAAALVASGVTSASTLPVRETTSSGGQGTERSYPIPSGDAVDIDQENDIIIVRQANHIYAYSLSCPHENTALRWRAGDLRFQCPRH